MGKWWAYYQVYSELLALLEREMLAGWGRADTLGEQVELGWGVGFLVPGSPWCTIPVLPLKKCIGGAHTVEVSLHFLFKICMSSHGVVRSEWSRFTRCDFRVMRSLFLVVIFKFLSKALRVEGINWASAWHDSVWFSSLLSLVLRDGHFLLPLEQG